MRQLSNRRTRTRGQVIIMVTLALIAMFGIMGLAVDVGWSFFVRKRAQGAADSAAMAAVLAAFEGGSGSYTVGTGSCPGAGGSLSNGCLYSSQNGFAGGGTQTVTMEGGVGTPLTVPYISAEYYVIARVRENIPQLFSGILGNTYAITGARATAAILAVEVPGSLILLNRQRDCLAWAGPQSNVCGVNLWGQGNSFVKAPSGIMMASTRHGDDLGIARDGVQWAGDVSGAATVQADMTLIRGAGTANASYPTWDEQWTNGFPDSDFFKDPMRTLNGQPPAPPAGLPDMSSMVVNCTITGGNDAAHTLQLSPGKYYSLKGSGGCQDGDPIKIQGYVEFLPGPSGFGDYVFFGGLATQTSTNATLSPGRYVLAGTKPKAGVAGALFDATSGQLTLTDKTPLVAGKSVPNTDAGELFIFTGPDSSGNWYPGLDKSGVPAAVLQNLTFGTSGFQTGNNNQVTINLHGLNENGPGLPNDLKNYFIPDGTGVFQPVLLWQDQRNSVTKYYDSAGVKQMTCIVGDGTTGCTNALAHNDSPMLFIQASAQVHLYGIIYQPRGSWTVLGGGEAYSGPLRLISGAIRLYGGADLDLQTLGTPMVIRTVALIE